MYLAVLAVFPADLIRIPRCPYGVWPKLFSWSPYWVSGCLCREFRRNWNLLETNTNIHMRRQHTVDDDMKERLNRPKYIDCGPGKCGSTLVIQDGCKKAIMPREKLLGKKKWVEVSSSKKQMLARQSPLNKDNKICNRCYLKEVSLRKSSLRATETPSPFPVSPAAQKPASARLGADPTVPATETPGTALQKLLGKRKWANLLRQKNKCLPGHHHWTKTTRFAVVVIWRNDLMSIKFVRVNNLFNGIWLHWLRFSVELELACRAVLKYILSYELYRIKSSCCMPVPQVQNFTP